MDDGNRLRSWRVVWPLIKLGRPQFLLGGFATYGLGAAIASSAGCALDWRQYHTGQAVVTCFQLMTHYANDYFDLDADCANLTPTRWSGGSRILPAQPIMHSAALVLALSFLGIGLACAFFLLRTQLASVVLVLSIAALAWTYSAPPIRLHSRGVGELAAAVVVAALVPWLGCAVQRGGPSSLALAAVLPLVLIQFAMLLVIGVPDRRGDACVGKRTLVVRLGVRDSATLHNVALVTAYVFMTVLWALGLSANVMAAFVVTAPLACLQLARVAKGHFHDARHWEGLAFGSVALVLLSALAELVGFLNAT